MAREPRRIPPHLDSSGVRGGGRVEGERAALPVESVASHLDEYHEQEFIDYGLIARITEDEQEFIDYGLIARITEDEQEFIDYGLIARITEDEQEFINYGLITRATGTPVSHLVPHLAVCLRISEAECGAQHDCREQAEVRAHHEVVPRLPAGELIAVSATGGLVGE